MKPIFENECLPRLREALPQRFIAMRTLKAGMIGESACDARIAPIYKHYPDIETTILANGGDIQLNLICEKPALDLAQARVDELAGRIEEELDELIYSTQGESLEEIVLLFLGMKGATLAVAESCTGGMVAERITGVPGSSRAFLGGAIVYSDELKTLFAGVDPALIAQHGAVSAQVAKAMAEGIRKAAPILLEPVMRVETVTPGDYLGDVIGDINRRRGMIQEQLERGTNIAVVATAPRALAALLPGSRVTRLRLITGVAAHDIYHASQIQLLKKQYGRRRAGR